MTYTPKMLQPEDLERLFGQLNDPYRAIAQVAYLTGARAREVLLLKTEQLTNQQIMFDGANNKFGKSFSISMTDDLAEIFGRIMPSSGYVFSLNSGKDAISVDKFGDELRRAVVFLGLSPPLPAGRSRDRPQVIDTEDLLTPHSLLKGKSDDGLGEKSSPGSELSSSSFQPGKIETPGGGQPRDLASLQRELHRLRSQYAAARSLGDQSGAANFQRTVEQLGFDA